MSVKRTVVPDAGQELLDLSENAIGVADPWQVVISRHLDQRCFRDVLGEVAPGLDRNGAVAAPVDDQGRDANRLENRPDVDLGVHPRESEHRRRAGTHPKVAGPVGAETLVVDPARCPDVQSDRATPISGDLLVKCLARLE